MNSLSQRMFRAATLMAGFLVVSGAHAQTLAEGADHATQVLGTPWDMSTQSQVFPLLWTHNLSSAQVANGIMTGVARDTDPHFWLQFPRIPSAIEADNHTQAPIDADTHTQLAFMMWLPSTVVPGSRNGRLVWHTGGSTVPAFDAAYSETPLFPVYPGWHLYQFDLASLTPRQGTRWTGQVQGVRIDPCVGCQVEFKLDWARLYNDRSASASVAVPPGKAHLLAQPWGASATTSIPASAGRASLARLPPGQYRVAPISDGDYALSHRGKAWSFDTTSDLLWASNGGFSNPQVGSSGFTATTVGPDPFVLLDIPPNAPVSASKYRYISIDMTLSAVPASESGLLVWWGWQPATVSTPSAFVPVQTGRFTYRVDLGSSAQWTGDIRALRIDPLNGPNANSGVQVTLHSVRLTQVSGFEETVVFNPQPVAVNARPQVTILSPGHGTGSDYALVEQGQPWRMSTGQVRQPTLSNLVGWEYIGQIPSMPQHEGPFFHATSQPAGGGQTEGDPHAFLAYQENTHPINTANYRYLGFDLYVPMDAAQQSELTRGAVGRIAWKTDDTDPGLTSDDIVLMPGLQRYWFDMNQLVYEPATNRTWRGLARYLRIDPFEFPESRHFYLGQVQLRSPPSARWVVPVDLQLTDADGDTMTATIRSGSAVLGQAQGLGNGTHQLLASVAALPDGEHTFSVEVSDGINITVRTASVPVLKLAAGAPLPAHEVKSADRIFDWAEATFASTLGAARTPSLSQHACLQLAPGAYGRYYANSGICLFSVDGLVAYTINGAQLTLLGTTANLLSQATPTVP